MRFHASGVKAIKGYFFAYLKDFKEKTEKEI